MIKGPKAILSSAIANALSEFFVIDPNTDIESNLLQDAKIILRHVHLKPLQSYLNTDTAAADTTEISTSGCVDKVVFSWTWNVGGGGDTGEWIRDALLVIEGAKFDCCLKKQQSSDQFDAIDKDENHSHISTKDATLSSSFVDPSTIDDKSAKAIKSTPGGIAGFVSRQIEMVIDNLTLRMVDFELRIHVFPSATLDGVTDGVDAAEKVSDEYNCGEVRSFFIGIDQVELLSFGRQAVTKSHHGDANANTSTTSVLKQRINLRSFRASVSIQSSREVEECSLSESSAHGTSNHEQHGNMQNMWNELAFLSTNTSDDKTDEREKGGGNNANIINSNDVDDNFYHLVEPFSYSANVTRIGSKRFSGLMTGVDVVGIVPSSGDNDDSNGAGGIALHMGKMQVESLAKLSEMILAPPSTPSNNVDGDMIKADAIDDSSPSPFPLVINGSDIQSEETMSENDPSSFVLPLLFATLVADDKTLSVSDTSIKYKADGTVCRFDARKVSYGSIDGGRAEARNILCLSIRPIVKLTIDSIDALIIPNVLELEKPVEFTEVKYEGNVVTARFHTIKVMTFENEKDSAPTPQGCTKQLAKDSVGRAERKKVKEVAVITAPKLPFSLDINVKGFHVKKRADESSMEITNFQLFCNGNVERSSSDVALNISHFQNHLASVSDVYLSASFPWDESNCINALNLSVRSTTIASGHSVQDWQEAFQPKLTTKVAKTSSPPTPLIMLPNAAIADMKLSIVVKTKVGVKVNQTPLTIKAFNGKDGTTSKDIINYYTMACLSRVPEFISNAEVLGLNVVDNTAATWGNFVGIAAPFGGFTGLAAVVGVDAVKNTLSAGKRGRGKGEGDNYEAGDVARGLFQAAKEATNRGATMRGMEGSNTLLMPLDWAVGATTTTTEYVGENKKRLGGAAAGGGGFIVGMALGGPVGAVIGGLVTSAVTGKTIQTIDEHHKKK